MKEPSFENKLSHRLADYEPSNAPDVWEEIERKMNRRKYISLIPIFAAGVAATALLFVFGLRLNLKEHNTQEIAANPIKMSAPIASAADHIFEENSTSNTPAATAPRRSSAPTSSASLATDSHSKETILAESYEPTTPINAQRTESTPPPKAKTRTTSPYKGDALHEKQQQEIRHKNKTTKIGNSWTLALAGSASINNNNTYNNRISTIRPITNMQKLAMVTAYGNETPSSSLFHAPAISASLLARWMPIDWFGLESGLSYTFLYSSATSKSNFIRKETQELHYLGIPLNLYFKIVSLPKKFSLYTKIGGQVDFNISARWREIWFQEQKELFQDPNYNRINAPQYSAHLAIGVNYQLTQHLNLSIEPSLIYYFDTQNPIETLFTKQPLNGGLNLSLSYQF